MAGSIGPGENPNFLSTGSIGLKDEQKRPNVESQKTIFEKFVPEKTEEEKKENKPENGTHNIEANNDEKEFYATQDSFC